MLRLRLFHTPDEKEILIRAFGKIEILDKRPAWFKEDFYQTFGFNTQEANGVDYYYKLQVPASESVDISDFSEIYIIQTPGKNTVEFAGRSLDLTPSIKDRLRPSPQNRDDRKADTEPIYINAGDSFTLVITYVNAEANEIPQEINISELEDLSPIRIYGIEGFAVR